MDRNDQERRSFLFALGGLGMSQIFLHRAIGVQIPDQAGSVLGADEGEHLIHFRDRGNVIIKFGAATGSTTLAMGTHQGDGWFWHSGRQTFQDGRSFFRSGRQRRRDSQ
jgi:hypothetical protein